jgi:drug/metabolite transporter (DMT)-like permease
MARQWVNPLIRCSVYLYFAAGIALLVSGGMASAIRYLPDKRVPATILLIVFGGIFFFLAFGNWETFRRPISSRKWIFLCLLSSLGLLLLLFAPTSYGGSDV